MSSETSPLLLQRSKLLTDRQLLDLRARQRTSAGYFRTGLGEMVFALVILRLFEQNFAAIGVLYTMFALLMLVFGWLRSELGRRAFERTDDATFVTCGGVVLLTRYLTHSMHNDDIEIDKS